MRNRYCRYLKDLLLFIALAFYFTNGVYSQLKPVLSPEAYFGHRVGDDKKLIPYDKMVGYYEMLDNLSPRVRVQRAGNTTEGRPMLLVIISEPSSIQNLNKHMEDQKKIADPRLIKDLSEKDKLIQESKIVVWINCQLHSTETAASQMALELAYQLSTSETPEIEAILKNVIIVLVPCANPDGQQMISEWYERTLNEDWEGNTPPYLYHKYSGHDNNRDWYMLNLKETRVLTKVLYNDWFPTIYWDLHQTSQNSFRLFLPPYCDPQNPNVHPLINYELLMIGGAMSAEMRQNGMSGIINSAKYDNYWSGHSRSTPFKHNMAGILTEAASVKLATPVYIDKNELKGNWRGFPVYDKTVNFPDPWTGGWWRLRDIVDYEKAAAMGLLKLSGRYHDQFQANYIQMGEEAIEQGKSQPPYAWIIPPDQKDPGSAYEMLERLRATSVEVHLAKESFLADGKSYPKGTYILFCAQPCRPYIMDLMENQTYPHKPMYFGGSDDPPSAPNQSYISAWTFPLQMGLKRVAVQKSFICAAEMIDSIPFPQGMVSPRNTRNGLYVVKAGQNDDYRLINRLYKSNIQFSIFNGGVRWTLSDGSEVPPGSIIIPSKNLGYNELKSIDKGLSCNVISTNNPSAEIMKAIRITSIPRLALYQPATSNTDEGWTRYVLENYEFPFTTLHDKDIIGGNLIRRFDCIILPSENTDGLIQGNLPGSTFPEYTGGLGDSGKNALKEFIEAGGNLVCIDGSCNFAIETFSLPVKNILINDIDSKGVENRISTDIFFCPGSLLRLHIDVNHPLGYGMNEEFTGFFTSSQAFKPEINNLVEVVSTYGDSTLLESGWIRGEKLISGKPAILDIPKAKGRIILLGFRIQHRAQMHGTFRILFNAIQQSTFDR